VIADHAVRGSKKQEVLELEAEAWDEDDHVDPVQASMDEIDVEFQPMPIEEVQPAPHRPPSLLYLLTLSLSFGQGGEDKNIDGMIARLLAPGDYLSLSHDELFLCARVSVVSLISTFASSFLFLFTLS
jgi:hypothetical protein